MEQFLQSLQSQQRTLISKIKITVTMYRDGKGDAIGCKDADTVLLVLTDYLKAHEKWIRQNEPLEDE